MKTKLITLSFLLLFSTNTFAEDTGLTNYVDPHIGSEGLGRVFIGPSCPYGMVKPSPDCTPRPNSGWLPIPNRWTASPKYTLAEQVAAPNTEISL